MFAVRRVHAAPLRGLNRGAAPLNRFASSLSYSSASAAKRAPSPTSATLSNAQPADLAPLSQAPESVESATQKPETSSPTPVKPTPVRPAFAKPALRKVMPRANGPPAEKATLAPKHLAAPEARNIDHLAAAAPLPEIPSLDYANSYYGISTMPVSTEQYELLTAPTPVSHIEVKPDGVIYLPEIRYRRKLNEAFGPMGWGMVPKSEPVVGDNIVTREYALFVNGRFASQAQGENNYFSQDQLPSAVEGCKSNALMRCCKDLGISSELWDPNFNRWFKKTHMEEAWVEHATTKKKRLLWFKKGEVDVQYPYKLASKSSSA